MDDDTEKAHDAFCGITLRGEKLDSIVITSENRGSLETANDGREVIAIISSDAIVLKNGYEAKLVPA